ncbi:MAG TPA: cupin domain-containing protein [Ktedonobacterales bacterium]
MSATEATDATKGELEATGVFPDGGRSVWLMGMLITFKAISEDTGGAYSVYVATIPPGMGAPPHIHHQETEAFYLLEGELDFIAGERAVHATSSDFLHVDKGMLHGYTNPGPAIARYVGIVTPGGLHERLFAALGEEATTETLPPPPAGPPDMARLIELASKYHTELLPPPER